MGKAEVNRWATRAGVLSIALGALLLSPLTDLLPVDLFAYLAGFVGPQSSHAYFRVVPEQAGQLSLFVVAGAVLIAVGFIFVIVGRASRS